MTTTSRDVLAVVRRLAGDVLFPEAMRVDRLTVLPAAQLDALAAEGLYGAPVPVQAGGLGLDLETYCAVAEELASGCLTTTFVWLQHRGLAMTLAAEGTPARAARPVAWARLPGHAARRHRARRHHPRAAAAAGPARRRQMAARRRGALGDRVGTD